MSKLLQRLIALVLTGGLLASGSVAITGCQAEVDPDEGSAGVDVGDPS